MNRRSKLAVQESKEVCHQLKKDVVDILELAASLADDIKVFLVVNKAYSNSEVRLLRRCFIGNRTGICK